MDFLASGYPVLIYRSEPHWSVIYGYNGSSSVLEASGFRVKCPTLGHGVWDQDLVTWKGSYTITNMKINTRKSFTSLYVNDSYIINFNSTSQTVDQYYCLASGKTSAPIRSSPHNEGMIIGNLENSMTVHCSAKGLNGKNSSYWYYIDTGSFAGNYIYCDNIKETTPPALVLSFSDWSDKKSIGATDAVLANIITADKGDIRLVKNVGVWVYDGNGALIGSANDTQIIYYENRINVYYKISSDMGIALNPNTTYRYVFWAEYQNGLICGLLKGKAVDFVTTSGNSGDISVVFNDIGGAHKYATYSVGSDDATLITKITLSGITAANCSKVEIQLYDESERNLLSEVSEGPGTTGSVIYAYYTAQGNKSTASGLGYTFSPGTTYKYRFYIVLNEKLYYSEMSRFTTSGVAINFTTLDVNGILDGEKSGCVYGYGTFDVYINGALVYDDVSDFYSDSLTIGTSYLITDIRTTIGHIYNGTGDSSLSGTLEANTNIVELCFETEKYSVVYNVNGGNISPCTQYKIYGIPLTLSSEIPTRIGYTFEGWGTDINSTSSSYNSGEFYKDEHQIVLYAIWKINALSGDINGDGKIKGNDATLLLKYLADWNFTINEANSDCNGDGKIKGNDATLLLKYLAEWKVTLG